MMDRPAVIIVDGGKSNGRTNVLCTTDLGLACNPRQSPLRSRNL